VAMSRVQIALVERCCCSNDKGRKDPEGKLKYVLMEY
jgi:hypothetical protein